MLLREDSKLLKDHLQILFRVADHMAEAFFQEVDTFDDRLIHLEQLLNKEACRDDRDDFLSNRDDDYWPIQILLYQNVLSLHISAAYAPNSDLYSFDHNSS